jgi:hypothetical protein
MAVCKKRNIVKRWFNRLGQWRDLATRYADSWSNPQPAGTPKGWQQLRILWAIIVEHSHVCGGCEALRLGT